MYVCLLLMTSWTGSRQTSAVTKTVLLCTFYPVQTTEGFPVCADLTLELFCVACISYTNTSLSKYYSVVACQFEACMQKLSIILFKNSFPFFLEKYKYGTSCRFIFLYGNQSEHETESHFLTRNARITSVWKLNWLVSVIDQLLHVN